MKNNAVTKPVNNEIEGFFDEYEFLTLSYPCEFKFHDIKFHCAGTAYYAQVTDDLGSQRKFSRLNAQKARLKAKTLPEPEGYSEKRKVYLYEVNKAKFDQNPDLKKKLCDTRGKMLINKVPYRAEYLGVYMGTGTNMLGRVLMELRDEYLNEKD